MNLKLYLPLITLLLVSIAVVACALAAVYVLSVDAKTTAEKTQSSLRLVGPFALGLIVLLWFGAGMDQILSRFKQKSTRITVSLATYLVLPVVLCIGLPALVAFLIYGGIAAPTGWRELRSPLSNAFRRFHAIMPAAYDNGETNTCQNKNADDFIAETPADLMFLRVPAAHAQSTKGYLGRAAWREEWLRGGGDFWEDLDASMSGKLGSATETKSQYIHLLEETLRRDSHIKNWAIAHVESGFIQTQDIVDCISEVRRVDTIYTKDFSELTGAKAVIIRA